MSSFVKVLLAKNVSSGNLRLGSQSYYCYFLPKVLHDGKVTLSPKASLEFVTPSEMDSGEPVVKSYRMEDPAQVRLLILDLIKLYAFFKKDRDELNEFTIGYLQADISRETLKILKAVREGVYDNGI